VSLQKEEGNVVGFFEGTFDGLLMFSLVGCEVGHKPQLFLQISRTLSLYVLSFFLHMLRFFSNQLHGFFFLPDM